MTPPPWLTRLVLGEYLNAGGVVLGRDPLVMCLGPAVTQSAVETVRHVRCLSLEGHGARCVRECTPVSNLAAARRPVILHADDLISSEIDEVCGETGRTPDAILTCAKSAPLAGYVAAGQAVPDLFIKPDARQMFDAMKTRAQQLTQGMIDSFDLIQGLCAQDRILRRIVYRADGDVFLELAPLPMVRGLTKSQAGQLLLGGAVRLNRWNRVHLRVPVFGIKSPEIHLQLSGTKALQGLKCTTLKGPGLSTSGWYIGSRTSTLHTQMTLDRCDLADLSIAGHGTELEAVLVRLPTLNTSEDHQGQDPLSTYQDALASYEAGAR